MAAERRMTVLDQSVTDYYAAYNGDSVEVMKDLPDKSIGLSVFSPPFAQLYVYSPSERDMGNCADMVKFREHLKYLVDELLRVTMPGRVCAVHVADVPAMLIRDGWIGMKTSRRGNTVFCG
jgi:hypothetical protein